MYCKDCKHWNACLPTAIEVELKFNPLRSLGGWCNNTNLKEYYEDSVHTENSLVYRYGEGGSFWTGAKFGCVNFEDKCEAL